MTPATRATQNGVRSNLTNKRERGSVENKEFAAFAKRILKAFSRRVAQGDIEALADLLSFAKDLDGAIDDAVTGLREFGYTWTEIAARAGVKKQTAQERWGRKPPAASADCLDTNDMQLSSDEIRLNQLALFDVRCGEVGSDAR